jgi:uncharacterized membrane protein
LFGGLHVFSILLPSLRDGLQSSLGTGTFKGLYALVSLLGLALMIKGYIDGRASGEGYDLLYEPVAGARHVTMLLVLLGFILIGASHGQGYLKLWIRNPMSLGIVLWSAGHLLANGERAVVLIFGIFVVIGLLDIVASTVRGKRPDYEPRLRSDIIAVIIGIVLYAIFLFGFHPYILQIPVV